MNRYRPLLRPASFATLPKGLEWHYAEAPPDIAHMRPSLPRSRRLFPVIATYRELSADKCARFNPQAV